MKKSFLLGLSLLAIVSLTGCDILNSILPTGNSNNSAQKSEGPVDNTVYGKGEKQEKLIVDADIPAGEYVVFAKDIPQGERASVVVYKSASTRIENVYFSDSNGFATTSMVTLSAGQVVVGDYCTYQNINSNPKIGELKDGIFKVGTHFQIKNKVLKVKGLKNGGRYAIYGTLSETGYYSSQNLTTSQVTNLLNEDEVVSIPYIENGAYVEVDNAEVVVE